MSLREPEAEKGGQWMTINQYDEIRLSDGRDGCVVEILCAPDGELAYLVDVGDDPDTWDNILVTADQIQRVL